MPTETEAIPATPIRAAAFGAGVQSTALMVLAAQGRIDFPLFLMANVGDDSEHPASLRYAREVAVPFAEANGLELGILNNRRHGQVETLYQKLTRPGSRSTSIPYRSHKDGPPMSRSCTVEFKMRVLGRELKARGASPKAPATVAIGISLDEIHRANRKPQPHEQIVYPLVGVGEETGLKMTRLDCMNLIRDAGLPIPPKSSCWFCPFHSPQTWADMARETPDLFDRACDLETRLRNRSTRDGNGPVFLTRFGIPLRDAIDTDQPLLPLEDLDNCDTGWCMT